jgi:8-oxo-dGTP pyrophosphatase MutT (NUDIX family)
VIPRPPRWRTGESAPWAKVPETERRGLALARVLDAFSAAGQDGPVPESLAGDAVPGLTLLTEGNAPITQEANAGVLGVLFEEDGETRVVLTRRSTALRTHKGEVSFPGGRLHDGETPTQAALREAHEEVALDPALVTLAGWLYPVVTFVSGSVILPVIGTVETRPHLVGSPAEVERVFDVALAELADPSLFHEERWSVPGRTIPGSPDGSFPVWFFEIEGELIWGATARMLHELLRVVLLGGAGT